MEVILFLSRDVTESYSISGSCGFSLGILILGGGSCCQMQCMQFSFVEQYAGFTQGPCRFDEKYTVSVGVSKDHFRNMYVVCSGSLLEQVIKKGSESLNFFCQHFSSPGNNLEMDSVFRLNCFQVSSLDRPVVFKEWSLKCVLWTSSISTTWELVSNADSQAAFQTCRMKTSVVEPDSL